MQLRKSRARKHGVIICRVVEFHTVSPLPGFPIKLGVVKYHDASVMKRAGYTVESFPGGDFQKTGFGS